jgi:peptide/nickel transport system substrate-binding protein
MTARVALFSLLLLPPFASAQEARLPGPDPAARVGGILRQTTSEPSTLNLYASTEGSTRMVMTNILESLFVLSDRSPTELDPALAASWEVSEDGRTCRFRLREGVTWSDGKPFTADDVEFTYEVLKDGVGGSFADAAEDVEALRVVGAHEVEVTLRGRRWGALNAFGTAPIIPRHWYRQKLADWARAQPAAAAAPPLEPGQPRFEEAFRSVREACVGTGPYRFAVWNEGRFILLHREPSHWRRVVEPHVWNMEGLSFGFLPSGRDVEAALKKGDVDLAVIDLARWEDVLSRDPAIRDAYELHSYDHAGLGYNSIVWNTRRFPFDDARVRRAMTHLVDREGLLRDVYRGAGFVATCPDKRAYPEYDLTLAAHPFDLARATALLAEAGFTDANGDKTLEKKVGDVYRPLSFTLDVPSGRPEYGAIAERFGRAAARVGVRMETRELEWSVFIERLYDRQFEAMCLYLSFSDPWIDHFEDYHSSQAGPRLGNTSGLSLPEVDRLLEELRGERDRDRRATLSHELYGILHEQQPETLLIHGLVHVLVHRRVRNVVPSHRGMRATYWWIDEGR